MINHLDVMSKFADIQIATHRREGCPIRCMEWLAAIGVLPPRGARH